MELVKKSTLILILSAIGILVGAIFITPIDSLTSRLKLPVLIQARGSLGEFQLSRVQYKGQPLEMNCRARLVPLSLFAFRLHYHLDCQKPLSLQGSLVLKVNQQWYINDIRAHGNIAPLAVFLEGELAPLRGLNAEMIADIPSLKGFHHRIEQFRGRVNFNQIKLGEQEWLSELKGVADGNTATWQGDGAWVEAQGSLRWSGEGWVAETELKAKQQPTPPWLAYFGQPDANGVVHIIEQGSW